RWGARLRGSPIAGDSNCAPEPDPPWTKMMGFGFRAQGPTPSRSGRTRAAITRLLVTNAFLMADPPLDVAAQFASGRRRGRFASRPISAARASACGTEG